MTLLHCASTHHREVLWQLYRPLLRAASDLQHKEGTELRNYVRNQFRRSRKLGNQRRIQAKLEEARQLLSQWRAATTGDAFQAKQVHYLISYLRAITPKRSAEPTIAIEERPVRTPGIIHSTAYHDPLPRLKPQPHKTSMMIFKRRQQIQRRWDRLDSVKAWAQDVTAQQQFEKTLGVNNGHVSWDKHWSDAVKASEASINRERMRSELRIPPALQAQARAAHVRRATRTRAHKT